MGNKSSFCSGKLSRRAVGGPTQPGLTRRRRSAIIGVRNRARARLRPGKRPARWGSEEVGCSTAAALRVPRGGERPRGGGAARPLRRPRPRGRGRHRPGHLDEEAGAGSRARHRSLGHPRARPHRVRHRDGHAPGAAGDPCDHRPLAHRAAATGPMLATASNEVGTPAIRTMGTIGGNVCKSGPSQDTPPVLVALEAELQLIGPARGTRRPHGGVLHRALLHHPRARRAASPRSACRCCLRAAPAATNGSPRSPPPTRPWPGSRRCWSWTATASAATCASAWGRWPPRP